MSMDRRRFVVGLAAGLLLGVAVISASGALAPPQFASFGTPAAATTTAMVVTTTGYSYSSSTETGSQYTVGPGAPNSTNVQSGNGKNATNQTSSATANSYGNPLVAALAPLPSSSFAAISTQGPRSDALLLIPVAFAFVLGALLYRSTLKNGDAPEEDEEQAH